MVVCDKAKSCHARKRCWHSVPHEHEEICDDGKCALNSESRCVKAKPVKYPVLLTARQMEIIRDAIDDTISRLRTDEEADDYAGLIEELEQAETLF